MQVEELGGYITVEGAAKKLGITKIAMYRRVVRHKIPVIRVGKTILILLADIEK